MSATKRFTILIVEDEEALREFLVDTLLAENFQVLSADGGNTAWDLLQSHEVDLLVTDSAMPDGNGFQLISKLENKANPCPSLFYQATSAWTKTVPKSVEPLPTCENRRPPTSSSLQSWRSCTHTPLKSNP